jgi:hypothetical protein
MAAEWEKVASVEQLASEHHSLEAAAAVDSGQGFAAGLVRRAGAMADADMAQAVREREDAIASRARALAEEAVRSGVTGVRPFGPPPGTPSPPRRGGTVWPRSPPNGTAGALPALPF